MNDFVFLMWKPLLACLILTGIHAYLGIHIIERKVIFVDLSLAQMAALGATVALLFEIELHSTAAYWFSLGATLLGAVIFSMSRMRREKVPQEAIIGIVYAVSTALAVLILSRTAEGDEQIRHMLVGNILLVGLPEILKMAVLYGVIGIFHWKMRKIFLMISAEPEKAFQQGIPVKAWDFVFYVTFGIVVTSSVEVAGVLLVFSFLVVPAVAAVLFAEDIRSRLFLGWGVGSLTSLIGIGSSYYFDLPTGATVICCFGGVLLLLAFFRKKISRGATTV